MVSSCHRVMMNSELRHFVFCVSEGSETKRVDNEVVLIVFTVHASTQKSVHVIFSEHEPLLLQVFV